MMSSETFVRLYSIPMAPEAFEASSHRLTAELQSELLDLVGQASAHLHLEAMELASQAWAGAYDEDSLRECADVILNHLIANFIPGAHEAQVVAGQVVGFAYCIGDQIWAEHPEDFGEGTYLGDYCAADLLAPLVGEVAGGGQ